MKCAGLIVMVGLMFALPAQAAEEAQPQGSQKEVKRPAEENNAATGKAATGKEASGEKKKKEGEKNEGGGSEPGCD